MKTRRTFVGIEFVLESIGCQLFLGLSVTWQFYEPRHSSSEQPEVDSYQNDTTGTAHLFCPDSITWGSNPRIWCN